MNNCRQKIVKRKTIALETKIAILNRLADGEGSTAVANEFKLGESTIRAIYKRASKINESANNATNESSKRASYSRNIVIEKTEKALVFWIKDLTKKRIPIHGDLIKEKAKQYFNQLKDLEPSNSISCPENLKFSASNGWLTGFLRRYTLHEMIEDETINDSDIINNLINCEDEQEEPDPIAADKIYAGIQLCKKLEKHFVKIDTNSERSMKFQKELRSCISGYRDLYKQLTKRSSSQKLITDFMVTKNKSIDIVSSSDESDFEPIRHKKMRVLDYDE